MPPFPPAPLPPPRFLVFVGKRVFGNGGRGFFGKLDLEVHIRKVDRGTVEGSETTAWIQNKRGGPMLNNGAPMSEVKLGGYTVEKLFMLQDAGETVGDLEEIASAPTLDPPPDAIADVSLQEEGGEEEEPEIDMVVDA